MSDEYELHDAAPGSLVPGSLAHKLTRLLDQCVNPTNGKRYSLPVIAEQINTMIDEQYGHLSEEERERRKLSRTYLWELKTGRKDNPARRTLQSLATYLGVPVGYLTEDASSEEQDAQYLVKPDLNMRARGLSPRGMENVLRWIEHARELEGLGDPDAGSPVPPAR